MSDYHLPYHFIPVTGRIHRDGDKHPVTRIPYERIASHGARHDLWLQDKRHGRIVCRLMTKTPLVVGNKHTDQGNQPTEIALYQRNGQPAIAANSLRGMIGSVMETLSQSALRVLSEKYWPFFDNGSEESNFQPWHPGRRRLTPAELIFGVAEEIDRDTNPDVEARNLASRVWFHDALPASKVDMVNGGAHILRVLGQPRPIDPDQGQNHNAVTPYFYPSDRSPGDPAIRKDVKSQPDRYKPLGRKVYLSQGGNLRWKNSGRQSNQNSKVEVIGQNQPFWFHIDFDNLSNTELTLLVTALIPGGGFRHRLGMGKSLGLGSVEIDLAGVFFIDRASRYCLGALESETGERYAYAWLSNACIVHEMPGGYEQERNAREKPPPEDFAEDPSLIDDNALRQLSFATHPLTAPIRWRQPCEPSRALPPFDDAGRFPAVAGCDELILRWKHSKSRNRLILDDEAVKKIDELFADFGNKEIRWTTFKRNGIIYLNFACIKLEQPNNSHDAIKTINGYDINGGRFTLGWASNRY